MRIANSQVSFRCANGKIFEKISFLSSSINQDKDKRSSVELKCANIDLYADDTKIRSCLEVWCEPINWNLYESSEQFDWCPSPMASYLLATLANNVTEYLAGVCYNIDQQQIQSVYFVAAYHLSKHKVDIKIFLLKKLKPEKNYRKRNPSSWRFYSHKNRK